jgi:hypothetical protein
MEHNKEENMIQGTEHLPRRRAGERAIPDGQQVIVQCSQESAKLRSEPCY